MAVESKHWNVQVRGDLACFTSPSKVERDSYPIITPSAARGIIDSILWKPAIRWVIDKVYVLNPIKYTTIRRNELKEKPNQFGVAPRDLRTTRALRDVNYIIEAHFYMTDLAGPTDNLQKFTDMFERRMAKGQSFRDPFLGCREFPAQVTLFEGDPLSVVRESLDIHIGTMVYDFKSRHSNEYHMFTAGISRGVMEVPQFEEFREVSC